METTKKRCNADMKSLERVKKIQSKQTKRMYEQDIRIGYLEQNAPSLKEPGGCLRKCSHHNAAGTALFLCVFVLFNRLWYT